MLTDRTNKSSVRFAVDNLENDTVTERAVRDRYEHLLRILKENNTSQKLVNREVEEKPVDSLSLSLPVTPRALDGYSLKSTLDIEDTDLDKRSVHTLETIEKRINLDFIKK